MCLKTVLTFCAQALFIQVISGQYLAAPCAGAWGVPYAAAEWDCAPAASLSASNGPGVAVATASPLLPSGVSVHSENAYEGTLAVDGALPFLGTVAFEGALPSAGAGVVAYNCGSGVVGITAEDQLPGVVSGIAGPIGYGAIGAPLGAAPLVAGPLSAGCLAAGPLATGPLAAAPIAAAPCAGTWGIPSAGAEWAYAPASSLAASNGAGLAVSSASSLVPTGVSVQSENIYEGGLAVGGAVPFLGTVALEGALPTAGAGAVSYSCGNGAVGITAEEIGAAGFGSIDGPLGYGSGLAAPFGLARSGWGCGVC